jgi:transcriptional regulator with XRE-family HTH domain
MLQKTSEPIESELLQRIGNTLKTRRQALHLSQIDLADRAQVHRTYIGNIEHGTRNITVSVLVRLARALDIPFTEIADLVDHLNTDSTKNCREVDSQIN